MTETIGWYGSILSWRDFQTVDEVIGQFEFSPEQARRALATIEQEWRDTSGRFYAYTTACRVCAAIERENHD